MLMDAKLQFSANQSLTSTAATTIVGTNDIDLGPLDALTLNRDIGAGAPLYLVSIVTTTFASTGAATLIENLVGDDNTGMTSTALVYSPAPTAIALGTLVAGYVISAQPLPKFKTWERYLRMNYVVGTAPFSAGAVMTAIVSDIAAWTAYAQDYQNLF